MRLRVSRSAALAATFLAVYGAIFAGLVAQWRNDENYSHGFLVVPFAAFVAWTRRDALRSAPLRPSLAGLALVVFGSFYWLVDVQGWKRWTRPFAIYGPGLSPRSMIGTVIRQTRSGNAAVLRDLRPVRDFCYVGDLAAAIVRACSAPLPRLSVLNVGSGRGTSVGEIARMIVRLRRRPIAVEGRAASAARRSRTGDRLVADPRRARRLLGWRSRIGLGTGLRRTIRWMDAR